MKNALVKLPKSRYGIPNTTMKAGHSTEMANATDYWTFQNAPLCLLTFESALISFQAV
jgi:hypothetical protein